MEVDEGSVSGFSGAGVEACQLPVPPISDPIVKAISAHILLWESATSEDVVNEGPCKMLLSEPWDCNGNLAKDGLVNAQVGIDGLQAFNAKVQATTARVRSHTEQSRVAINLLRKEIDDLQWADKFRGLDIESSAANIQNGPSEVLTGSATSPLETACVTAVIENRIAALEESHLVESIEEGIISEEAESAKSPVDEIEVDATSEANPLANPIDQDIEMDDVVSNDSVNSPAANVGPKPVPLLGDVLNEPEYKVHSIWPSSLTHREVTQAISKLLKTHYHPNNPTQKIHRDKVLKWYTSFLYCKMHSSPTPAGLSGKKKPNLDIKYNIGVTNQQQLIRILRNTSEDVGLWMSGRQQDGNIKLKPFKANTRRVCMLCWRSCGTWLKSYTFTPDKKEFELLDEEAKEACLLADAGAARQHILNSPYHAIAEGLIKGYRNQFTIRTLSEAIFGPVPEKFGGRLSGECMLCDVSFDLENLEEAHFRHYTSFKHMAVLHMCAARVELLPKDK